ncbi:Hsp70 family protein [Microbacterium sp. 10M-3C3]|uniref:Hsp70 family protein n=1 Tax=Microbacterium sp. 10M-3C3 TaxID=2483401 RepID=UPI000F631164|nr:Hsp70 family protein [Microbacterium sp. 10M-3C3]
MSAPYFLAIDIGTSRTSAATARWAPDGSLIAAPFALGRSSDNTPTVAFAADGDVLFGDAAERRGATQPDRLIREFKRRVGDDVPILAGDRAFTPEELYAEAVDWVARAVIEREGATPAGIALTVPAAWGAYRAEHVRDAIAVRGWRDVLIVTEPEAAARHYEASSPLAAGRALAVYDFGGGTFDAVVLRKEADGSVHLVGQPSGLADLGGADFDDLLVRHVVRAAHVDAVQLSGDVAGRMALAALRRECVEAKESLSFDSEAVVPVLVSNDQRTVRVSRDEFELMIADDLERTLAAFEDALETAGTAAADIEAILLTGGSSRIPRVAQMLSERFDRPIAVDADPKAIIALGAARIAADAAAADAAPAIAAAAEAADPAVALFAEVEAREAPRVADAAPPRRGWLRRAPRTALAAAGLAVVASGTALALAPSLGAGMVDAAERTALVAEPGDGVGGGLAGLPDFSAPTEPGAAVPAVEIPAVPTTPTADAPRADGSSGARSAPRTEAKKRATPVAQAAGQTARTGTAAPTGGAPSSTGTAPSASGGTPSGGTPTPADSGSQTPTGGGTTDPGTTDPGTGGGATDPGTGGGTTDPGTGGGTTDPGTGGGTTDPGTGGGTTDPGTGGGTTDPGTGGGTTDPGTGGSDPAPSDPPPSGDPSPSPSPTVAV